MNDRILFIIDTDHGAAGWQPDCTVRFGSLAEAREWAARIASSIGRPVRVTAAHKHIAPFVVQPQAAATPIA